MVEDKLPVWDRYRLRQLPDGHCVMHEMFRLIKVIWRRNGAACQLSLSRLDVKIRQIEGKRLVNFEVLAEIDAPDIFVLDNLVGGAAHQHVAVVQNVGSIDNFQCFPHVMVGNQNTDIAFLQVGDKAANLPDGDGIYTCKGLVQQQIIGISRQTACDLGPSALTASNGNRGRSA